MYFLNYCMISNFKERFYLCGGPNSHLLAAFWINICATFFFSEKFGGPKSPKTVGWVRSHRYENHENSRGSQRQRLRNGRNRHPTPQGFLVSKIRNSWDIFFPGVPCNVRLTSAFLTWISPVGWVLDANGKNGMARVTVDSTWWFRLGGLDGVVEVGRWLVKIAGGKYLKHI